MKRKRKKFKKFLFRLLILSLLAILSSYLIINYRNIHQVQTHESQVEQSIQQTDPTLDKNLVLAIILTETKGQGVDVMQSSESVYGERGKMTSSQESIENGVRYLSEMIETAKENGCDLWTGVQAYNFGPGYITYVAKHGGQHSIKLAESYSKNVLSKKLGNQDAAKYRYVGVRSLLYNGGYLYHNGGNFFYSELVKINQKKMDWFKKIF